MLEHVWYFGLSVFSGDFSAAAGFSALGGGGGVTFGPTKERSFKKKINKKVKRKALLMVLSVKAKNNLISVLDKIDTVGVKTKSIANIIKKLPINGSVLIILPKKEKNINLATRNLSKINTVEVRNLNCLDLLHFKYLIITKETIKVIKEMFIK